ncbi:MAG: hydroxyacid-oxoacid transhydrogenase [Alphaproteobacteria bacterium]
MALTPFFYPDKTGNSVFSIEAPRIKFGTGALAEVGWDAKALGLKNVALIVDPAVRALPLFETLTGSLDTVGIEYTVFDRIVIEPTERSMLDAAEFATEAGVDGFISLGGGSTIDTAKVANLLSTYPADLKTYVNKPVGAATPPPGPLKPHIACPTTFGTASESTGIAVFDFLELNTKTGIAHRHLRPTLGVLDPTALDSLPPLVLAANGFDVFSHAMESLTARSHRRHAVPEDPSARPLSQGSNPFSDLHCLEAIRIIGENLVRAVETPGPAVRENLMFAGMLAGLGFGNAGCHIPHGMSYAVAGLVRDYYPEGWRTNTAMAPHGIAVIVNAPAVLRMLSSVQPDLMAKAALVLSVDLEEIEPEFAGDLIADRLVEMMRDCDMPNGLMGLGFTEDDIDALTQKTMPQRRLLDNAPMILEEQHIRGLFEGAMRYW